MKQQNHNILQTLERGLLVITSFGKENPSTMSIAQIAQKTNLNRATVRRVLLTLQSLQYATENQYRLWSLTPKVLELGFSYLASVDIWELAYPHMVKVSELTGEACSITVLDGDSSVYIARVPANKVMSITLGIGSRLPAWVSSHGRVHLSGMDNATLEAYLKKQTRRAYTNETIWGVSELMNNINNVRTNGYSLVINELEYGLAGLAVPIKNKYKVIKAALNISTHTLRTPKDDILNTFLPILKQAAEDISKATIL